MLGQNWQVHIGKFVKSLINGQFTELRVVVGTPQIVPLSP